MASTKEIIERLARLEEKADSQREDIAELKKSVKELGEKVNSMDRKMYLLWVVATGGIALLYDVVKAKVKMIFGGHA